MLRGVCSNFLKPRGGLKGNINNTKGRVLLFYGHET